MTVFWVVLLVLGVAALLLGFYFSFVESLYPEKLRTQEVVTITTGDIWRLRMCRYRKGRTTGEPVLLVHGATTNQHNFTSPEGGCLVDYLVERGYDCWTVDLRGTHSSQPPFERRRKDATLDGSLLYDLPAAIKHIRRSTGYAKVHYVGHSLGGMLLYAYVQEFGDDYIASGVTMGSPVGFSGVNLRVPGFTLFMVNWFPRFCGKWIRGAIPFNLLLRRSPRYLPTNVRNLHPKLNTGHFVNLLEDPLPHVAQELAYWARNKVWRMKQDQLDVAAGLASMRFPLLAFFAPRDRFVPIPKAEEFFHSLPSRDKAMRVLSKENGCAEDYDHCDIPFSRHGAQEVFHPVVEWFQAHPVTQRIGLEEMGAEEGEYVAPLASAQRAEILSGQSYAHVHEEELEGVDTPVPSGIEPAETLIEGNEDLDAIQLEASDPLERDEGASRPVAAKRSARSKTAAKTKARPAAAKTVAKPKPKAKAKPKPAKPSTAAKADGRAAKKAASKTAAAKKPAARKATAKKPAAKKKPTASTRSKKSSAAETVEVPERTRSALSNAAAQLKQLDSSKKK